MKFKSCCTERVSAMWWGNGALGASFGGPESMKGTSKNCHCSSAAPNLLANDSALFPFRFCAVHPKDALALQATAIIRGPLKGVSAMKFAVAVMAVAIFACIAF